MYRVSEGVYVSANGTGYATERYVFDVEVDADSIGPGNCNVAVGNSIQGDGDEDDPKPRVSACDGPVPRGWLEIAAPRTMRRAEARIQCLHPTVSTIDRVVSGGHKILLYARTRDGFERAVAAALAHEMFLRGVSFADAVADMAPYVRGYLGSGLCSAVRLLGTTSRPEHNARVRVQRSAVVPGRGFGWDDVIMLLMILALFVFGAAGNPKYSVSDDCATTTNP